MPRQCLFSAGPNTAQGTSSPNPGLLAQGGNSVKAGTPGAFRERGGSWRRSASLGQAPHTLQTWAPSRQPVTLRYSPGTARLNPLSVSCRSCSTLLASGQPALKGLSEGHRGGPRHCSTIHFPSKLTSSCPVIQLSASNKRPWQRKIIKAMWAEGTKAACWMPRVDPPVPHGQPASPEHAQMSPPAHYLPSRYIYLPCGRCTWDRGATSARPGRIPSLPGVSSQRPPRCPWQSTIRNGTAPKGSAWGTSEAGRLASRPQALSDSDWETLPGVIGDNLMQGPPSQARQQ